ncbi:MAG: inositol monophosphatase [Anaerolineales bacterium]|nr:inositol monophosphatase [Anaerolineales bacterium]
MFSFALTPEIITRVLGWLHTAGLFALGRQADAPASIKADGTQVTPVDLELERYLTTQINHAFPDHNVMGEESGRTSRAGAPVTWIIDPLDGTSAYLEGIAGWAIAVGILVEDRPVYGFHYAPRLNEMTFTDQFGQVIRNGLPVKRLPQERWHRRAYLAVGSASNYDYRLNIRRCRTLGSVSTNIVYTACGLAAAAFIPKACAWDLAAPLAILQSQGAVLRYLSGGPFSISSLLDGSNLREPLVAAHPTLIDQVCRHISYRPPTSPLQQPGMR